MHAGYRRPGPIYRWRNWWGVMLIESDDERDIREVLRAEDEAIAAALRPPSVDADAQTLAEIMSEGWEAPKSDGTEDRPGALA